MSFTKSCLRALSYLTNKCRSKLAGLALSAAVSAFFSTFFGAFFGPFFSLSSVLAAGPRSHEAANANHTTLTANQVYVPGSRNPLQRLDVYAPTEESIGTAGKPAISSAHPSNLPVILYIHGGSFCSGDKVSAVGTMPQVFTNQGFVFVSIDYRLSPASHFPAHVQDLASAISWVHRSISRYGGDPSKIFLLGHSAGAQLAALVSIDERYLRRHGLGLRTVSGVVLLDGGALDVTAALLTDKRRPINSPAFGANPAVWRQASPVYHVKANKNIPPFLIYYLPSTQQSTEQNSKLISALRKANVPHDVHVIENKNHREINEELGRPEDPEGAQIVRFFKAFARRSQ